MTSTISSRAVAFLAAASVGLAADCAPGGGPQSGIVPVAPDADSGSTASSSSPLPTGAVRIALVVDGEHIATATLVDTPTAREFAMALPVSIEMEDRMGQAKTGQLPDELPDDDAEGLLDPEAGHIAYWPPDGTFAVVTADLGPSIPAPGLVVLGVVDSGLDALAAGHGRFEMTVALAG